MRYVLDRRAAGRMAEKYRKRGRVKLCWVHPLRFLERAPHVRAHGILPASLGTSPEDFFADTVERYTALMKKGKPLPPLLLDFTRMYKLYPLHDGRHRAFAALRLGIGKVPVLTVT